MPCVPYDPSRPPVDPEATRPAKTGDEVPKERTTVSGKAFADAAIVAYTRLESVSPSLAALAAIYGQWSLETDSGRQMFNYAVGNVTWSPGAGPYFLQWTGEPNVMRKDGVCGEGWHKFLAYPSLDAALYAWFHGLKTSKRYGPAWAYLSGTTQTDPETVVTSFVRSVVDHGYLGDKAPEDRKAAYVAGAWSRAKAYLAGLGGNPAPPSSTPLWQPLALIGAAGSILGAGVWYWMRRRRA